MTDQKDYRTYLELQFKTIHDTLERIEDQTRLTNGRVNELEKELDQAVEWGRNVVDTRVTNCPNIKRFEKLEAQMETLHIKLEDAMFFIRHPKLFIGTLVVLVLAAIATIIKEYLL